MSNPANPQCAPAWKTTPEIREAMKADQHRATLAGGIRDATADTLKWSGETPINPCKDGVWLRFLRWANRAYAKRR